jgi:hypothetical protein
LKEKELGNLLPTKTSLEKYIFILLLLIGIYQVPLRLFGPYWGSMPGDLGDTRFNNYILEHGYLFFTGKLSHYWNAPFLYPEKNVITYSDNLFGTLPIYSLFRILLFDRETSLQLWILVIFILNFLSAYWVFLKFGVRQLSASIGAYIFTFSLPVISNLNHLQMLPYFMIPFAFYGLINYLKTFQLKSLLLCVASTVIQFYCGMYLGFFLLLGLFITALAYIMVHTIGGKEIRTSFKGTTWQKQFLFQVLAVLLFTLLLYPLIKPYYQRASSSGMRRYSEIIDTMPIMISYFIPYQGSVMWQFIYNHIPPIKNIWYHNLFPGGFAIIASFMTPVLFLFNKNQVSQLKLIMVFLISLITFILITMKFGIDDFSVFKYIRKFPGFSSMRSINRCIFLELFFFAALSCYLVERLIQLGKNSIILYAVLPGLVVIDQSVKKSSFISFSKAESKQRIEKLVTKVKSKDYSNYEAFIYMPNEDHLSFANQIDAMLASQELNFPTVNGYTATYPSHYYYLIFFNLERDLKGWMESNKKSINNVLIIKDS